MIRLVSAIVAFSRVSHGLARRFAHGLAHRLAHRLSSPLHPLDSSSSSTIPRVRPTLCNTSVILAGKRGYECNGRRTKNLRFGPPKRQTSHLQPANPGLGSRPCKFSVQVPVWRSIVDGFTYSRTGRVR